MFLIVFYLENDSKEVARPTKLPRHDPKPTKPSSVVPKDPVAVALDEERAVRVIAIELDFLMGRRTAAVPLALLRNEWRQLPKGTSPSSLGILLPNSLLDSCLRGHNPSHASKPQRCSPRPRLFPIPLCLYYFTPSKLYLRRSRL